MSDPRRVLLITDRPFIRPVDGSSHTYRVWLDTLRGLGCVVSVLSFSRFSQPWMPDDLAALHRLTERVLILEAHASRAAAARSAGLAFAWRVAAGRRFLPLPAERGIRRGVRNRIASFLEAGRFDAVVLNKLGTATLVGRSLLARLPAIRIIDMHDNYPAREALTRQVSLALLRRHRRAAAPALDTRGLLSSLGWATAGRYLREEVKHLRPFDHVVFNAANEADTYRAAGLPAGRITVLPLPRGTAAATERVGDRPFALGVVASASLFNLDALSFLAHDILPRLKLTGLRILVAGTSGRFARSIFPPGSVETPGWVEDIADIYAQVELVLVPLRHGTGVSVKTMEAAHHGAAIVATSVGLRGVSLQPGRDVLVADTAADFARTIDSALADPARLAILRHNARAAIHDGHSQERFAAAVAALLQPTGACAAAPT